MQRQVSDSNIQHPLCPFGLMLLPSLSSPFLPCGVCPCTVAGTIVGAATDSDLIPAPPPPLSLGPCLCRRRGSRSCCFSPTTRYVSSSHVARFVGPHKRYLESPTLCVLFVLPLIMVPCSSFCLPPHSPPHSPPFFAYLGMGVLFYFLGSIGGRLCLSVWQGN